jgi:hypothetical protein
MYGHLLIQLYTLATRTPTIAILKNPATVVMHPKTTRGGPPGLVLGKAPNSRHDVRRLGQDVIL